MKKTFFGEKVILQINLHYFDFVLLLLMKPVHKVVIAQKTFFVLVKLFIILFYFIGEKNLFLYKRFCHYLGVKTFHMEGGRKNITQKQNTIERRKRKFILF